MAVAVPDRKEILCGQRDFPTLMGIGKVTRSPLGEENFEHPLGIGEEIARDAVMLGFLVGDALDAAGGKLIDNFSSGRTAASENG